MFAQIGSAVTALTGVVLTLATVLSTRSHFRDDEETSVTRQPPNRPVPPMLVVPPTRPMPPHFGRAQRNAKRYLQAQGNINVGPLGPVDARTGRTATAAPRSPLEVHAYAIDTRRRARENARVSARMLRDARTLAKRRAARGWTLTVVAVVGWLVMIIAGALTAAGTNNAVSAIAALVAVVATVGAAYAGVAYAVTVPRLGGLGDDASHAADQLSYADADVERCRAAALAAGVPIDQLAAE